MNNYYDINNFMMPAMEPSNMVNNQNKFVNTNEGFLRGNMEDGSYIPYKNMTYIKPNIDNQRQMDLYKLQEICFAAHDANLYLDTHPTDTNMIRKYNEYLNEEKRLTSEYEKKYGPLDLSDDGLNITPWAWIEEPWPWKGDSM